MSVSSSPSAPLRPLPYWLRILGDLLGQPGGYIPDAQHPHRADVIFITSQFTPYEVSSNADERLYILTAFAAAGFVYDYKGHPPALAHLSNLVMGSYQGWDPEGVARLTKAGRKRALEYLEDLVYN